jgi:hypothetical protein
MESSDDAIVVELSREDAWMICEALETYEYWEVGYDLPRNNGYVWLPGDDVGDVDRYWGGSAPSEEQLEAIEGVKRCRALVTQISESVRRAEG